MQCLRRPFLLFLFTLCLAGPAAEAATYMRMEDEDLLAQAAVVAEVRVLAADPSPGIAEPVTDYLVEVERVLKGFVPGSAVVVRLPGGRLADGRELTLFGVPRFAEDERALLFLNPADDGTWAVVQLFLGAFHVRPGPGGPYALRDLGGAREVSPQGGEPPPEGPRRLAPFRAWLEDRAQGSQRDADYFAQPAEAGLGNLWDGFRLFSDAQDRNFRWAGFDSGASVFFRSHQDGQPGIPDGGVSAFQTALAAWTNDPGSVIRLTYGGTTNSTNGLTTFDSQSTLIFSDPNDHARFEGAFTCTGGGVIAIGGPWSTGGTNTFKGTTYVTIAAGDIVTNKGIECWINTQKRAEEVFAHELGHTLGIDHSNDNQALMRGNPHSNNRGATLAADDRAAACFLYGNTCTVASPPAAPSGLTATAVSPDAIQLTWQDGSNDETSFELQRKRNGGFSQIASLPAGTTSYLDGGLASGASYTYRVRARNANGPSGFSNQAGATTASVPPPAAPDQLAAQVLSDTQVRLTWRDNAGAETGFEIEARSGGGPFQKVKTAAADAEATTVSGLAPYTDHAFRVRATGAGGPSAYSGTAAATTHPTDTSRPAAPGFLLVVPQSSTEALLVWQDAATNELGYRVERRTVGSFELLATTARDTREMLATGLTPGLATTFRVRATGVAESSPFGPQTTVTLPVPGTPCTADDGTACLLGGSFQVRARWYDHRNDEAGQGHAEPLSDQSTTFWFFADDNTELIVKALDGRVLNDHFWLFYGALSDVEYWVTVTETSSGAVKTYRNRPGNLCGTPDTKAFPGPHPLPPAPGARSAGVPEISPAAARATAGSCTPGLHTLCLLDGRIRVEVAYDAPTGDAGPARFVPGTDRTGFFWFFEPTNIELTVKAIDGRTLNGSFWIFWGALSNVRYELTVTDTETGASKTYVNEQGRFCGGADTSAL